MVSHAEFNDRHRSSAESIYPYSDSANGSSGAVKSDVNSVQKGSVAKGSVTQAGVHAICQGAAIPTDLLMLTLPDLLQRAARYATGVRSIQPDGSEQFQSYAVLFDQAQRILAGLRAAGLQPQDKVILQLQHPQDFLVGFWGCVLGGFVPVPIAVPPSYTIDNGKTNTLRYGLQLLERATILTTQDLETSIHSWLHSPESNPILLNQGGAAGRGIDRCSVMAIETLLQNVPDTLFHQAAIEELALILLTSGSTGSPKGVMLNVRNLLVSAYGMATANGLDRNSITLNWMPLEHVASLVMFHLTQVFLGCQQIHAANEMILQDPLKWLDLVDQHRVTATWAPNFAYGLVNDRAEAVEQRAWDLSCLRWMGNGAEAVVGKTTRRFLALMLPHKLNKTAVSPGYGMSETCSGIIHSHRFSLETTSDQDAFVDVGTPIPGVSIRIADAQNQPVAAETIGLLQVSGLTVSAGYYNRPELNTEIFTADGWFNTGDLGFLKHGRLTITGRQKEVIITNGANYYNHEIEAIVEELDGVEVSYTAACAVRRTEDSTDRLAIFFSPSGFPAELLTELMSLPPQSPNSGGLSELSLPPQSPNSGGLSELVPPNIGGVGGLIDLLRAIRRKVMAGLGVSPDYVIPVASALIPKTAIGKIQRRSLSQRFEAGEFDVLLSRITLLQQHQAAERHDLPRNRLQGEIAGIWQEVLGLEQLSLRDNFFELGGNSLRLLQVLHRLQQAGHSLSVVDLFQYPSIEALAQRLSQVHNQAQAQQQPPSFRPQSRQTASAGIAVIGMAGRFPGAESIAAFWQNLCDGVESISWFTDAEILASGVDPALLQHPDYVKASPILADVAGFDAEFFGYSTREAEVMDPQQRLLLECAWESLESAGYNPFTYAGAIGLYAGASMNTYLLNHVYPNRHQLDDQDTLQVVTLGTMGGLQMTIGNDKDYLTTRVSYKLNLTGPSVNVQTACSTSLVTIHLAAQSLLNGECDMALAGGVSVHAPQQVGHLYQSGMILTPDGHCRAFDAQAQGTIFGSGAGVVVLKRLEAAIEDGDCIYAVIKGSAIGNDGSAKVGYLAPSADGQATVAAQAISIAGIDPATISYVEAHGTGTELGDPIEIAGLTQAFGAVTQKQPTQKQPTQKQFCAIGSVKTNVGHLNIASGVVGFIKTVLSLHHKQLPASLHFATPNPKIDFANSPFYVNTVLSEWQTHGHPRRAGVNSLGIGGTNVHVVLEEKAEDGRMKDEGRGRRDEGDKPVLERPFHLLALAAKNDRALQQLVQRYEQFLAAHPEVSLPDLCFTANTGRSHFEQRLAIVTDSVTDLREQLAAYRTRQAAPMAQGMAPAQRQPIAFLFTGQGCQYPQMGRQLYDSQPVFRAAIDHCAEILAADGNFSLLDVLYPQHQSPPELGDLGGKAVSPKTDQTNQENSIQNLKSKIQNHEADSIQNLKSKIQNLDETASTQPALFAVEYALCQLWQSWGIEPTAVMGHSLGEYVAACVAGVFSLADGLKLVAARARLMQALPQGEMVAVLADQAQVAAAIDPYGQRVSIAAINGPENIVIAGEGEVLGAIILALTAQGIQTRRLNVSHAFHSPRMQPIQAEFLQVARQVTYSSPRLDLISNLTGERITDAIATPDYWCRHICQPVLFAASLKTLRQLGYNILIECGPKPILLDMSRANLAITSQNPKSPIPNPKLLYLPSLHPDRPDWQQLLQSLSQLYVQGGSVDWAQVDRPYFRRRIPLPTYPFQHKRYWLDVNPPHLSPPHLPPPHANQKLKTQNSPHPLLGQRLPSALKAILFQAQLSPYMPAFLADHRVYGKAIVPATAYLEMALAAGKAVFKSEAIGLETVAIDRPLVLSEQSRTIQLILTKEASGATFEIYSLGVEEPENTENTEADTWTLHCSGKIGVCAPELAEPLVDLSQVQQRLTEDRSPQAHYQQCQAQGIDYGSAFQGIEQLWRQDGEALGKIQLPSVLVSDLSIYILHPALLDACCQVVLAALPSSAQTETYLPVGLERFQFYPDSEQNLDQIVWSHVRLRSNFPHASTVIADVCLFDQQGHPIAQLNGLTAKRASRAALLNAAPVWQNWLYETAWMPQARSQNPKSKIPPATWLIFADSTGVAQQLADRLQAQQQQCVLVFADRPYHQTGQAFHINPQEPTDYQRLLNAVQTDRPPLRGVVYLWSLDVASSHLSQAGLEGSILLNQSIQQSCRSVLHLTQALIEAECSQPPRLWLVTAAAQAVRAGDRVSGIAQSPLWGLGKTIALEHPELRCTQVDLDSPVLSSDHTGQDLFDAVWADDQEEQLAFREGDRYVARLVRHDSIQLSQQRSLRHAGSDSLRLEIRDRGALDHLIWQSVPRQQPEAGEVEIQVCATGLNFRDVLNVLELYPGDAEWLGLECAGQIVAIGADVTDFQVGDTVVAIASGSFSQYVTVDASQVALKPEGLSLEAAVAIPIAFLTAHYTLHDLAKIAPGDRVLIHAAAGGVGLAAVQMAQQMGAEVFATASLGKWEFLKSLGIQHVMNSRSLDFAAAVMAATQGQGVDIVLNCLSGEFIPHSLSVLSHNGRFVEIGKQAVWSAEQVAQTRPDVSYFLVDLMQVTQQQPQWVRSTLRHLMQQFQTQHLQPLPLNVFARDRTVDAFRTMQQAQQIGKIVITQPSHSPALRDDGTYLITGGWGGLGLQVATWLVAQGAKHLLLVGRSSPDPIAQTTLRQLEAAGAIIEIAQADVADRAAMERVLRPYLNKAEGRGQRAEGGNQQPGARQNPKDIKTQSNASPIPPSPHPPIHGIIHAAGLLDDGVLQQQSWERFERVMAPKVQGAWNLHELTRQQPIDFFVMFSSAAALLGAAGQSNYAAANAFLDALAQARQAIGLPGLSINWGAWSQVGLAARSQSIAALQRGMGTIAPQQGLDCLGYLLSQPAAQVGVLPIDESGWNAISSGSNFLSTVAMPSTQQTDRAEFLQMLAATATDDRPALLSRHLQMQVARVLGLDAASPIDSQQGFAELGMDSLTSVELKNRLQTSLGAALPATLVFDYPTLATLTAYLSHILFAPSSAPMPESQSQEQPASPDRQWADIRQLSDAEAAALLQTELERLNY